MLMGAAEEVIAEANAAVAQVVELDDDLEDIDDEGELLDIHGGAVIWTRL